MSPFSHTTQFDEKPPGSPHGLSSSSYTAPIRGLYSVSYGIKYADLPIRLDMILTKNGRHLSYTHQYMGQREANNAHDLGMSRTVLVQLEIGETISVQHAKNTVRGSGAYQPYLCIHLVN